MKTKARHNNLYNKAIKQFENKKIDIITLSDIQSTLNSHVEDFSDDQLARIKSLWVRIYHIALISGCMVEDIPSMVQVPKSKKPATAKREEVTVETIEKMSDAITNYSTKHCSSKQIANRSTILYIFQLMRYTGMRPAEACALTVKDFNFNNKTISINKAVGSTNTDTECIIATKTATSVRNIPMSSECEKWAHDAILIHNMNISMGVKKNTDYVLARADGTLWDIDALCSQIRMIAIKNKLNFSLYDLRHKFASDLVNAGTPLSVIRDLMGHSNVAMSLSYSRSSEKDRHEAIDKIR